MEGVGSAAGVADRRLGARYRPSRYRLPLALSVHRAVLCDRGVFDQQQHLRYLDGGSVRGDRVSVHQAGDGACSTLARLYSGADDGGVFAPGAVAVPWGLECVCDTAALSQSVGGGSGTLGRGDAAFHQGQAGRGVCGGLISIATLPRKRHLRMPFFMRGLLSGIRGNYLSRLGN